MLLIDGVKYELWTPPTEDDFEQVVKEHTKEIFGEQSIYLDIKQKLKSSSGIGSIPDGYAILLGNMPQWHIIEVELSSHPLHEHIVSQVARFINGISNLGRRTEIVNAIYSEVNGNDFLKLKVKQAIGQVEVYKFLYDLISTQPILTIIIEKDTEGLREAISTLAYPQEIKIVEFQTFIREGVGLPVHAHLFEPLYKPAISIKPEPSPQPSPENSFKIIVYKSYMEYDYIGVWAKWKHLFPGSDTEVKLETDVGVIENTFRVASWGRGFVGGIKEWFKAHPELKPGDKLRITVIEPMKKYRLEILKE
jgi:hypothetical protein